MNDKSPLLLNNILYSCVEDKQRGNEQFVEHHALGFMISGESHLKNHEGTLIIKSGTIGLVRRNQLIKSVKVPPPGGIFKAINILFHQDALRRYAAENNIVANGKPDADLMKLLPADPFITGYFQSLMPYFDAPQQLTATLAQIKTTEAIELLLRLDPDYKNLLFDFNDPYKIDLEAFMNKNYMFNVSTDQFAKLTGRSLSSFKRDFSKLFNTSPGLWLQQKRLQEAYYLIKQQGRKATDVYLDVGFENLSHFSFAFKKSFGVAPSMV